jgi:hypothetical protein
MGIARENAKVGPRSQVISLSKDGWISQARAQNATAVRAIVSTPEAIPVKFIEFFWLLHQDRTTTTSSCPAN